MSLINSLKNTPKWALITLSIVIILFVVSLSFKWNLNKFDKLSKKSLSFFHKAYEENIDLTQKRASKTLSKEEIDILLRKVSILEQNKSHHADLIRSLYKNNYALLTLFPFLSAITAIIAFLILQRGWNESNVYLKTYFVLFTTITTLVGIYPEVYQQTETIKENLDTFLGYKGIQKTIFSYSLTAPLLEKDTIEFNTFLDRINTEEKQLSSIIFSIEKKAVDKDVFELK